jgi:hypothetical protein
MSNVSKNLSIAKKVEFFKSADVKNEDQLKFFKRIYKKYNGDLPIKFLLSKIE